MQYTGWRIVTRRVTAKLDSGQPLERAGFRKGFSPKVISNYDFAYGVSYQI